MTHYEQHVINLHADLEREVSMLQNEINGNAEDAFDRDARNLMVIQLEVMRQYHHVLSLRVEGFKP